MSYAADIGYSFSTLLGNVVGIVVRVLIFLAIMALGWLVAVWIRRALTSGLRRVGFDRAAERGGLDRMLGRYSASEVAARVVMYAFLLFVLQLAFSIFGPNAVSDLIGRGIAWLPRLLVAVVIVVVAAAVAGWVKEIISEALGGVRYGQVLATAAQAAIMVLAAFAALTQIGVAGAVIIPVLWALLFTVAGIAVVGLGGGLIKPMQHRWERMLNHAETEASIAAERARHNRGEAARRGNRDVNQPAGFGQPAYPGTMPTDERAPDRPAATRHDPAEEYEGRDR